MTRFRFGLGVLLCTLANCSNGGGVCGDGKVDGGEECDDGGKITGDGCSAVCMDEDNSCTPRRVASWSSHPDADYDDRLWVGGEGWVVVGEDNNLRAGRVESFQDSSDYVYLSGPFNYPGYYYDEYQGDVLFDGDRLVVRSSRGGYLFYDLSSEQSNLPIAEIAPPIDVEWTRALFAHPYLILETSRQASKREDPWRLYSIQIMDVTQPEAAMLIGEFLMPEHTQSVGLVGVQWPLILVNASHPDLPSSFILDATLPADLKMAASPVARADRLLANSDRLYFLRQNTLYVYDFTGDRLGEQLGVYQSQMSYIRDAYVAGAHLVLSDLEDTDDDPSGTWPDVILRTERVDVEDPSTPVLQAEGRLSLAELFGRPQDEHEISYHYNSNYFQIVAISPDRMLLWADYADYYNYNYGRFAEISIPDEGPLVPLRVNSLAPNALDLARTGGFVYLADAGARAVQLFDTRVADSPQYLGEVPTPGQPQQFQLNGAVLWVADGNAGLTALDVSFPGAPTVMGNLQLPGVARSLATNGTTAYVAADSSGLAVASIEDPANPRLLGRMETAGLLRNLVADGSSVFVVDEIAGLLEIDVTEPASPVLKKAWFDGLLAKSIAIADGRLYVTLTGKPDPLVSSYASGTTYLGVVRLSDRAMLSSPKWVNDRWFGTSIYTYGRIMIQGHFIYTGSYIYDVSDPRIPILVDYLYYTSTGPLLIENELAFMADGVYSGIAGVCKPRCGNGSAEYPEECDDGNLIRGDGCESNCRYSE